VYHSFHQSEAGLPNTTSVAMSKSWMGTAVALFEGTLHIVGLRKLSSDIIEDNSARVAQEAISETSASYF